MAHAILICGADPDTRGAIDIHMMKTPAFDAVVGDVARQAGSEGFDRLPHLLPHVGMSYPDTVRVPDDR